ncbi:hypothetical protein K505DRAFT_128504 [Melanomma pulvis-pyrius CBS 109.77]|uniref:Uncharacterized protein n=1 Tax=Melanomma pulvis-pyrius CBS 109.77 TaxID=1314802 RepID=A0A6A6WTP5_9PLEO|nr:hypothetical protein K505DRAFT_128504 [Melanomma pulvis-pyrius CBS 109.77]
MKPMLNAHGTFVAFLFPLLKTTSEENIYTSYRAHLIVLQLRRHTPSLQMLITKFTVSYKARGSDDPGEVRSLRAGL